MILAYILLTSFNTKLQLKYIHTHLLCNSHLTTKPVNICSTLHYTITTKTYKNESSSSTFFSHDLKFFTAEERFLSCVCVCFFFGFQVDYNLIIIIFNSRQLHFLLQRPPLQS